MDFRSHHRRGLADTIYINLRRETPPYHDLGLSHCSNRFRSGMLYVHPCRDFIIIHGKQFS
jgi:hypothetical protein